MNKDSAGWVTADQVVDEGQHYEESCRRCCESQTGQAFGKRSHKVHWQVTGGKHKHINSMYVIHLNTPFEFHGHYLEWYEQIINS